MMQRMREWMAEQLRALADFIGGPGPRQPPK
jgi:hypothetical protein